MADIYTTTELLGVVETIQPTASFWLPNYFPTAVNFDTEEIMFDKISRNRTLAPFVAPNVQGRPMMKRGFSTNVFKPAYIKPKDSVNPNQMFNRTAGESLGSGSLSPSQRWDAAVAAIMADHRRGIERRWEWMACQAALYGAVTVVGEDYPSTTVSFGRSANNRIVLSGTTLWNGADADILGNIEEWADIIFEATGAIVNRVTVSPDVWAVMRTNDAVLKLFETRRGSLSSGEIGPIDSALTKRVAQLGEFEIWTYSDTYVDDSGVAQKFMPAGSVFLANAQVLDGVQAFGAILDKSANLQPLSIYSKMWDNEDPSVTFIMSQSAPLMVPRQPDATLFATVL